MGKRIKQLCKTGDRISNLPDEVLTYMLSFLSTKDVVKTSLLSRRWKPLWACVPTLDLSDMDFLPRGSSSDDVERRQTEFLAFLYDFLWQHNFSRITKFCLRCDGTYDQPLVKSWVRIAKKNHVQELRLVTSFREKSHSKGQLFLSLRKVDSLLPNGNVSSYTGELYLITEDESILPSWMCVVEEWNTTELELDLDFFLDKEKMQEFPRSFTYDILVDLRLNVNGLNFPATSACFPKLKVLQWEGLKFENSDSASTLVSNRCPVLEKLEIVRCDGDNAQSLTITSQTLRRLSISNAAHDDEFDITIDTPNLQYMAFEYGIMTACVLKDVGLLATVRLECFIAEQYVCGLLGDISNVKSLVVSCMAMDRLDDHPMFPNLTHLTIHCTEEATSYSWLVIRKFLHSSPKLTYFNFSDIGLLHRTMKYEDFTLHYRNVSSSLPSYLKMIELVLYDFHDIHLVFIQDLLKNAHV